jgi:NAD(P)-dependent dehydrogenase (short-subunit alcohol dehydrogenase family)
MRLKDRTAVVTGGGRGLGRAAALALAQEGANVTVAARTVTEIERVAEEIRALGRRALAIQTDVSDADAVKAMVSETVDQFGTVDILVNCAGVIGPIGLVSQIEAEEWERTISVNLTGTFLCCQAALGPMMAQKKGKIVNVSSGIGTRVYPRFTAYGVSKAGVNYLTRNLAAEVQEFNIDVNAMNPSVTETQMQEEIRAVPLEFIGQQHFDRFHGLWEKGQLYPPEEPARLILFLASPASDGLTGQYLSFSDEKVKAMIAQAMG